MCSMALCFISRSKVLGPKVASKYRLQLINPSFGAMGSDLASTPWTLVGFAAWYEFHFECLKEACSLPDTPASQMQAFCSLGTFHPTFVDAVACLRKETVKKLGAALSDADTPSAQQLQKKTSIDKIDPSLLDPNVMIFKLMTKENIPSVLGSGKMTANKDMSYTSRRSFGPHQLAPGMSSEFWKLEAQPLGPNR